MTSELEVPTFQNAILAALPPIEINELHDHLALTRLVAGQPLHEVEEKVSRIYFLENGIASVMARTGGDDETVEVGLVGRDTATGIISVLGAHVALYNSVVMVSSGEAYRLTAADLHECLPRMPVFKDLMFRKLALLHADISQTAACNAQHRTPHRLARWLLMARDRASKDQLGITHDTLAHLLGVSRPSLSMAMQVLQAANLIEPGRSRTTILDRLGLEAAACPCYGRLRSYAERTARL